MADNAIYVNKCLYTKYSIKYVGLSILGSHMWMENKNERKAHTYFIRRQHHFLKILTKIAVGNVLPHHRKRYIRIVRNDVTRAGKYTVQLQSMYGKKLFSYSIRRMYLLHIYKYITINTESQYFHHIYTEEY